MAGKNGKLKRKKLLLGIGLDNQDGHTRVTTGENFRLVGGSEETHSLMQEKTIKLNEQLKRRGETLDSVGREEFREIAGKLGMPIVEPSARPRKKPVD